jgi:Uma2 family endonuclease
MRKHESMSEAARLVTAEELERFPDDGYKYELVEGRVVRMSPVGYLHARTVTRFAFIVERHVRAGDLGDVLVELGVKLASNPDTVRAPDVAFIRRDRIPSPSPRGFWKGVADLAVEVLSPDDKPSETRTKIK